MTDYRPATQDYAYLVKALRAGTVDPQVAVDQARRMRDAYIRDAVLSGLRKFARAVVKVVHNLHLPHFGGHRLAH